MTVDFETWRRELLHTGDIVQDGDKSVPQPERERRFNRYIEMLEAVSGQEGIETYIAILDSLQAKQDYGAYQRTYGTLRRFPPSVAGQSLVAALPRLIKRQPNCAGDILSQLARSPHQESLAVLSAFKSALAAASADAQKAIMDFVIREESDGWLDGRAKGVIRLGSKNKKTWWRFW
jgi:hypothetical protein